jgi:hypothetical protein
MYDPDSPVPQWTVSTMQRIATEPTLSAAALRYADLGIPVFPCIPGGKQPLTPNGFHDATSSSRIVHAWWRRNPNANIGLPTGTRSGVLVVDVDVHPGGHGFAAFERARSEGLGDHWGWLVRTPSGGVHAYYPPGAEQEQRSWQVPSAHIDFRGDGGYVIAPPSRIEVDGVIRTYEVIAITTQPAKPVDATGLRRFLEPPRPTRAAGPQVAGASPGCHPPALARKVASTPVGGRNRALYWASCRMAENNFSSGDIATWLMPAAQHAGLGDREIEGTIDSAVRHASPFVPMSRAGLTRTSEGIQR